MNPTPPESTPAPGLGAAGVLRLAVLVGLATGVAELIVLAILKWGTHRFIFVSLDAAWMLPLGDLLLAVALPGLLLALVLPRLPERFRWPLGAGALTGLGVYVVALLVPSLASWGAWALAAGAAVQAGRSAAGAPARWDRAGRRWGPGLLLVVLLTALGFLQWRGARERRILAEAGTAPAGAPNVLLLVLDTVRSMELSLYGYSRETTPKLAAWARRGVRFDRAISGASWTLPSHAVMLTGYYPQELPADYFNPLDASHPTLADVLLARGYRTAGFVANSNYLGWETGLQRSFSRYIAWPVTWEQVAWSTSVGRSLSRNRSFRSALGWKQKLARTSAETINQQLLDWLSTPDQRPYFAFLNYFDAHQPYVPPAPYDTLWGPEHSDGYPHRVRKPTAEHPEWTVEDARIAQLDYDRSLRYLDDALDRLLTELERRGELRNTIVILTSDHGEEFGEHGLVEHGGSLYRPSVQVPLLIIAPDRAPAGLAVNDPVSLRDIAATIADLTGLPRATFPGRSLSRWWRDPVLARHPGDTLVSELTFAHNNPPWVPISRGTMRSVVAGGYRYIRAGDGGEELFDFERDPMETTDLSHQPGRQSDLVGLRGALEQILRLHPSVR